MTYKPNFFIVGAPKCGTTAWVEYLNTHPDINFSKSKEPHYFNEDFPNFRWAENLEDYLTFFSDCKGSKIIGDASVQYLYSKVAARKISEFAPNARILIMLRNPAAFIRSYHNQLLINCDETETDLRAAWALSKVRPPEKIPPTCREAQFLNYKSVGMFSEQVQRFLYYFSNEQIKVVLMEDWIYDPRHLYIELMDFLSLDDDGKSEFPIVHSAKHVASRKLHGILHRPPAALGKVMSGIRMMPGFKKFRPSHLIRRLNTRRGYKEKIDRALMRDIDDYFSDDQKKLKNLLDQLK